METIQDYKILEKIAETRGSLIFRGRRDSETDTVIIKALKVEHPSPTEIARFKREYELIKVIDLDGVIKVFDIIKHQGSFAIVLEDFDGVSVKHLLEKKKSVKHITCEFGDWCEIDTPEDLKLYKDVIRDLLK